VPLSHVTPISVSPSSSSVSTIDLSSPSSSNIPPECPEVTSVSSHIPVWARKTLESGGSEINNTYDTHGTRSIFAIMTKLLATDDPTTYVQAKGHPHWEQTMIVEYESLIKNKTWTLVPLPPRKNLIGCKWVYKTKFTAEGQIEKYKARLAAKGFDQQEGIDYNETFSHVPKMNTIRTILYLVASYKWEIRQMDVKSTFLNGDLNEDIYMKQPHGFVTTKNSNLVCKLHKSLCGLKQAPRAWYDEIDAYFLKNGFK
jgi:hypothetical protein